MCLNIIIAVVFGVVIFTIYTASVVSELLVSLWSRLLLGWRLQVRDVFLVAVATLTITLCICALGQYSFRSYSYHSLFSMTYFSNYTLSNFL